MAVPLGRNRAFHLLWVSQAGSELGQHMFLIVYPLLAIALTDLPIAAGLVGFVATGVQMVCGLPAGLLADRYDRKTILVLAGLARALAHGSLAVAIWLDAASFVHLLVVAVVEGLALAVVFPAEEAVLPQVVPATQLPTAVALNTARASAGQMAGTSLGAALFGVARAMPFLANTVIQLGASIALLFARIPKHSGQSTGQAKPFWPELIAGLRWIARHPSLRVISLCAVGLNMAFGATLLAFIMFSRQRGISEAQIGLVVAMLGGGALLGALLASRLHGVVRPYVSITGVLWVTALLTPVFAITTNMIVAAVVLVVIGALVPLANTTVITYQLLLTPDDLRGRVSGAMGVFSNLAESLAPMVGAALVQFAGGRTALLICAAMISVPALAASLSPALRAFQPVEETV
ncbi:MFS transporter [Kibdelosporangium aridum]|uniref:MFS transporter n=1 Tax=Kibdelosporangium aridum TaxID=2030 RepID=UPI000523FAF4